jgi:predicted DNA-binding transcriptional regulator AlpA
MNAPARHAALPPTLAPRGLSRVEAAAYVGVSAGKFDDMVTDGRMPKPIEIDTRRIWDRLAIDRAFSELGGDARSIWDELLKGERA